MGWVGLGWVGVGWVGLGWVGLSWVGLGWVGGRYKIRPRKYVARATVPSKVCHANSSGNSPKTRCGSNTFFSGSPATHVWLYLTPPPSPLIARVCVNVDVVRDSSRGQPCAFTRWRFSSGCTECGESSSSTTSICGTQSKSSQPTGILRIKCFVFFLYTCRRRIKKKRKKSID